VPTPGSRTLRLQARRRPSIRTTWAKDLNLSALSPAEAETEDADPDLNLAAFELGEFELDPATSSGGPPRSPVSRDAGGSLSRSTRARATRPRSARLSPIREPLTVSQREPTASDRQTPASARTAYFGSPRAYDQARSGTTVSAPVQSAFRAVRAVPISTVDKTRGGSGWCGRDQTQPASTGSGRCPAIPRVKLKRRVPHVALWRKCDRDHGVGLHLVLLQPRALESGAPSVSVALAEHVLLLE
jgi:hypothetical protein